jgi:hypothetical protein
MAYAALSLKGQLYDTVAAARPRCLHRQVRRLSGTLPWRPALLLGQTLGAVRKPVLDIGTGPGFLALGLVTDKTCRLFQPENIQLLPAIDGFQSRHIFVAASSGQRP